MTPTTILIFEDNPDGHRLNYVRILHHRARDQGLKAIIAAPPRVWESPEAAIHLQSVDASERLALPDRQSSWRRLVHTTRYARHIGAARIVVPAGDRLLIIASAIRAVPGNPDLSLLFMRRPSFKGAMTFRSLAKWLAWLILSSRVHDSYLVSALVAGVSNEREVPDPVHMLPLGAQTAVTSLDPDYVWLAVLGAVTQRKNVHVIIQAIQRVTDRKIGLLLAGTCDATVTAHVAKSRSSVEQVGHRLVVIDRPLEEAELDWCVTHVDLIVAAHSNEGPSGIVAKAVAAGTPVLAAGAVSLRDDAAHRPDFRWVPLSSEALADAIADSVKKGPALPTDLSRSHHLFADRLLHRRR